MGKKNYKVTFCFETNASEKEMENVIRGFNKCLGDIICAEFPEIECVHSAKVEKDEFLNFLDTL